MNFFNRFVIKNGFSEGIGIVRGSLDAFRFFFLESGVFDDHIQDALSFEILDSPFGIDPAIEHPDEVFGSRADEVDMVGDEDLQKKPVLAEQRRIK